MGRNKLSNVLAASAAVFSSSSSSAAFSALSGPIHHMDYNKHQQLFEAALGNFIAFPQLPHTISVSASPSTSHLLPCVTAITSPEQFLDFLDVDDRLCVIK